MIKEYFIDGNNLIGKMPDLWNLQKAERQLSREKLVYLVDKYFLKIPQSVTIFFDGFVNEAIPSAKTRIIYCNNKTADDEIKSAIMRSKNPKTVAVVSSDFSVMEFARVSSCKVYKSESFVRKLRQEKDTSTEEEKIKDINNDEIKKLFGL